MPNIPLRLRLIVGLLFMLVAYISIIWPDAILYLVLGIFAIAALVDKFLQQQPKLEEKKPRKTSKKARRDDDIPDDPTYEELRKLTSRMAQGVSYQRQPAKPAEPVQYNLWGQPEPVRKPEQVVRSNNGPDWPSFEDMHPELFRK